MILHKLSKPYAIIPKYITYDGRWVIWREPYYPRKWYINRTGCDETECVNGFDYKWEAVDYLDKLLTRSAYD